MQMLNAFVWTPDVGDFFFSGLSINSISSFVLLCIVLCILSIIYEAMKINSAKQRARAARERLQLASSNTPSESANLLPIDHNNRLGDIKFSKKICKPLREALIFLIHNTLGYSLMLSVMIFNGYIFLVVVLSMGLGYFIFGHISMKINMENIQARTNRVICVSTNTNDPNAPEPSTSNSFSTSAACNDETTNHQ